MTHPTREKWTIALAAFAIAGAIAIGAAVAWADDASDNAAFTQAYNQAKNYFQQGKYAEAQAADDQALKLDPTSTNALLLRKVLQSRLSDTPANPTPTTDQSPATTAKLRTLTPQQISLIRLKEFTPSETLHGAIDHTTLEAFWNKYLKNQPGINPNAHDAFINPANFTAQVEQFRNVNDPEFLSHIQFATDPVDLLVFRKSVSPYVLQNCATSSCHGGDKAGNFRLILPFPPITDQVLYTNFYLLSTYTAKDGSKMIDRDDPDSSTFLQYSLPKNIAKFTHPGKIEPHHLPSTNDAQFKLMANWIQTLALPRPNYNVVYDLPTTAPTTKP